MKFLAFSFFCGSLSAQVSLLNLLENHSFEAPALTHTQNISGSFTLPGGWLGWAPSEGGNAGLVVGVDNGLAPAHGSQHFTFNGGNPGDRGWIEQSFATVPGATYLVTFSVGRAGGGQELGLLASALGGSTVLASGNYAPPGVVGYASAALRFTAGGAVSTIRFADLSGGNSISDLYLDNVAVSAVPEPWPYAVVLGAAVLVAAWQRRMA